MMRVKSDPPGMMIAGQGRFYDLYIHWSIMVLGYETLFVL